MAYSQLAEKIRLTAILDDTTDIASDVSGYFCLSCVITLFSYEWAGF